MPAYHVQRSTVIQAPAETVFDTVADFSHWSIWSPWLKAEKDAQVTVTDDPQSVGSRFACQGDLVGQREIEHKQLSRPTLIQDEIRILKPYPSVSAVRFEIQPQGDSANITCQVNGNLPWFLFWMKSNLETFVGMDYQRGLSMLKEYIETGQVLSDTEIVGVESVPQRDVVGVRDSCTMDEIGSVMKKAFETSFESLDCDHSPADAEVISIYHNTDMKAGRCDFTSGLTVAAPSSPPHPLVHYQLPSCRALHVRHTGSYVNLGNSWSSAFQYTRHKKLKLAKGDAFEIYRNDPEQTPAADLVTDIYVPLR